MKIYSYKEVADIIGIQAPAVYAKVRRKVFPNEFKTTIVNEQNKVIQALTEEGLQLLKDEYKITDEKVNEENKSLLGNLELVKQGDFLGTKCDFYKDMNDNIYMTRKQIAEALDYKDEEYVKKLHKGNRKLLDSLSIEISRFNNIRQNVVGYKALDNSQSLKGVQKQHHLESDINSIHQNDVGLKTVETSGFNIQGISDTPFKNDTNTSLQGNMEFNNIQQNVGQCKASENANELKVCQNDIPLKADLHPDTLLYNEDGIYEITFLSRQPKAEEFRVWVRERIKEIRKFGFTTQTNGGGVHTVDAMAEFFFGKEDSAGKLAFTELVKTKIKLEMENSKQQDLITAQNEELEKQKPKVRFAEQVAGSSDVISVNAMAKLLHKNGINIGQNRLYEWLRNSKLVMRIKEGKLLVNTPTQKAVDSGILSIEERVFVDKYGEQRISTITRVTPKGQHFILNKFLNNLAYQS